jgi:hypothetical protein
VPPSCNYCGQPCENGYVDVVVSPMALAPVGVPDPIQLHLECVHPFYDDARGNVRGGRGAPPPPDTPPPPTPGPPIGPVQPGRGGPPGPVGPPVSGGGV